MASVEVYVEGGMRLLGREGPTGLRLGKLCREAGVTTGSFYHHFASWDAFVEALLLHWEEADTSRLAALAARHSDPVERMDVLKHLAVTFPHEAEAAIRAWAATDARVAAVQRRVDAARHAAIEAGLALTVPDPVVRDRLASLGMAVLIGRQQLLEPVDVDVLIALFDEVLRLSAFYAAAT